MGTKIKHNIVYCDKCDWIINSSLWFYCPNCGKKLNMSVESEAYKILRKKLI